MVMKNLIFAFFILLSLSNVCAQDTSYADKKDFDTEIQKVNDAMMQLKKSNIDLRNQITAQNKEIDALRKLIESKEDRIQRNVDTVKNETQTQLLNIDQKISLHTILWIVITIIMLMACAAVYIMLRKRLVLSSKALDGQIARTREKMEAEGMKLDNKLMEMLEAHLQLLKNRSDESQEQGVEIDHSLALRVGEEIHRMRKRISNMPDGTKGIGALKNSLMRLEEEFNDNGYEIVDLLGKSWNDGLTVEARFIPSDELKPDEEIITKVIKPQINFKGVLIKAAEVEVSTGG